MGNLLIDFYQLHIDVHEFLMDIEQIFLHDAEKLKQNFLFSLLHPWKNHVQFLPSYHLKN